MTAKAEIKTTKSVLSIYYQNNIVSTVDIQHESSKKEYKFGRLFDNDIVIKSPIVSGHHGTFEIIDNKCIIKDLGSTNGIYVNKNKITECILENGDSIRIDDVSDTHTKGVLITYSLIEDNGDEIWNNIKLHEKEVITIGRDSSCDICIPHSTVSRNHSKNYKNK